MTFSGTTRARRAAGALVIGALVIGLAACGSDSGDRADEGVRKDTVTVALAADPASLDPARIINATDAMVGRAVYDTLVRKNEAGEYVPGLASSWEQKPDSVAFELRKDVTCADGTKLMPSMVAASLNRFADPEQGFGTTASTFGGRQATITGDDAAGTVTVEVDQPWSELLAGLTMPWTGIVCPPGLKDPKTLDTGSAGTGPYEITEVQKGRNIVLTRRSGYEWGPELGELGAGNAPRQVTFQIVPNESTVANLLVSGNVDAAQMTGTDVQRIESNDDFDTEVKDAGSAWLAFNEKPGKVFADQATREAASQAVDREGFLRSTLDGRGELIPTVAHPSVPCFDKDAEALLPRYDPDAATAVLKGKDLDLHVIGTTQVANGAGTDFVRAALEKAGAKATLDNTDTTAWSTQIFGGKDWDATVMFVVNPTDTMFQPMSVIAGEGPPNGLNVAYIDNPAFTEAFTKATTTLGDESCAAWKEAQEALVKRRDLLPLTTIPVSIVLRKGMTALAPQGGLIEVGSLRVS
jgi:peptide/nickel transport system substrate-binding protein